MPPLHSPLSPWQPVSPQGPPSAEPTAPSNPPEERRLVTALFCDLVGFTSLSESLDPEEVRDIQAAYFSAMSAQIERFGGIVEKYAGDAVLALFGVPAAHEDDPERAVLCALGMQQAILPVAEDVQRRYQVDVAVRVGVNTGEVVSGSWDASGQQQAAVTGDAINTAARMQAAAEPGGVLVGAGTMRMTRRRIRFGKEQALTLRGKTEPVPAYAALGLREQLSERWEVGEAAPGVYATPLVGRDDELATILDAWARVRAGEGQILSVIGEPGIGKSRVVAEGIVRINVEGLEPHRVVPGRCLSYGQSVSLWLIADLVRSLCSLAEDAGLEAVGAQVTDTVEEILAAFDDIDRGIARDVLGEVLGLPPGGSLVATAGPQIRRSSLIRSLGLVLGSLAEGGPLVLVLEDLHWLDPASAEILEALLTEVPGRRLLVLATQRPGWSAPWSGWGWTERLALRPLPDDEAAALAGTVLGGGRLSSPLEEHLRERAEGNPFFVEELVRYLQETGGLEERAGEVRLLPGVAERLPATLTEVLLARLDRLEQQVKGVAQVGSVIGRSFAVRLLARVMEREEALLDGPLRALQQAEIAYLREGREPELVFHHVLLRDAAYGMLVRRRQRQLHLAVARGIAQIYPADEYVEMIAYHYARTEEDDEAAEWLERAGDRASAAFANETALAHYREALERTELGEGDPVRQARVQVKLGGILNRLGRHEEARALLEPAMECYRAVGDLETAGEAAAELAVALREEGRLEEAARRLTELGALLGERGPSRTAVRLKTGLATVLHFEERFTDMLLAAEEAVELARALGDQRLHGMAGERRGTALVCMGLIAESREALEEAMRLLEGAGDLVYFGVAAANLGENRRFAGKLTEAVRLAERSLELTIRTGHVRNELVGHNNLADLLTLVGEWERAREHVARVKEIVRVHGVIPRSAPYHSLNLGVLSLREGDWAAAQEHVDRGLELARGADRVAWGDGQALRAELAILAGTPGEAQSQLEPMVTEQGANLPLLLPILPGHGWR